MKTKLLFFLAILGVSLSVNAQRPDAQKLQEMHDKKWAEISVKAALTEAEKKAAYPLFIEYENALWNINRESRALIKKVRKDREKKEKIDYSKVNNQYIEYELQQVALLKDYHEKLSKVLSPENLYNFYQAERMFKRDLMQNMQQHNKNKKD